MPEANGPWLGIDYGSKRIGVAFLGEAGLAAQPLATLRNSEQGPDWSTLARLIADWQPRAVVLGLPLLADGSEGQTATAARRFASALAQRYPLPLYWIDERLSSHAAEAQMRERELSRAERDRLRDQLAACAILESFYEEEAWRRPGT